MADPTPPGDLAIDAEQLRAWLVDVEPDAASMPLHRVAHGWDNEMWRLGDELAVRVVRRTAALELLTNEVRWTARVPELGVGTPRPRWHAPADEQGRIRWVVVPWFEGTDLLGRLGGETLAVDLGAALARLHVPAPDDVPTNPVRGIPLVDRLPRTELDLSAIGRDDLVAGARQRAETSPSPMERRWTHGDVHPGNVVVDADGHLVALIDFGDLGAGDEANDLAAAWLLFDEPVRARFVEQYEATRADPPDRGLWRRAEWWALGFCAAVLRTAPAGALADRCRTVLDELAPAFRA